MDRGCFSCEVLLGILALKIQFPGLIHLIRGNHECSSVTHHFGFREECRLKYGIVVYHQFCHLFKSLPLAATVSTAYGTIFACHGGLSPTISTISDIERINRYVWILLWNVIDVCIVCDSVLCIHDHIGL